LARADGYIYIYIYVWIMGMISNTLIIAIIRLIVKRDGVAWATSSPRIPAAAFRAGI